MNKIQRKSVIFDVGNVLIDWDVYHLFRKLLPDDEAIEAFLRETDLLGYNVEFDRGLTYAEGIAALCEKHPHHAALFHTFNERWMECVPGPIQPSVDILWQLKRQGVPLYAITNFSEEKWALSIERFDFLREGFLDVVVSAKEKIIKPDPAIFHICFERNGLEPQNCVFIDDSEKNIAAAEALGMEGILFTRALDLGAELSVRGVEIDP